MAFLHGARAFYHKLPKGLALIFLVVVLAGACAVALNAVAGAAQSYEYVRDFSHTHPAVFHALSGNLPVAIITVGVLGFLLISLWAAFYHAVPGDAALSDHGATNPASQSAAARELAEKQRQNDLAEKHNKLLEARLQPRFRFVKGQASFGSESFDSLELWNDGEHIDNLSISQTCYIQVSGDTRAGKTLYIPTYYFRQRRFSGSPTGLLVTFNAWQPQFWAGQLVAINETREFKRLVAEVRERFEFRVGIRKRVFLHISYKDLARVLHGVTYEIYPEDESLPNILSGDTPTVLEGLDIPRIVWLYKQNFGKPAMKDLTVENMLERVMSFTPEELRLR
jgi:hypothetical protein